jgi:hypothetical protein
MKGERGLLLPSCNRGVIQTNRTYVGARHDPDNQNKNLDKLLSVKMEQENKSDDRLWLFGAIL